MRTIRIGTVVATFALLALIAPGCGDDDGGSDEAGGSGGKASGGAGGAKGGSGGRTGGTAGTNTGGSKGGNTPTGGSTSGGSDNTGGTPEPEGGSPATGGMSATGGDDGTGGSAEGGMAGAGGAGAMSGGGSGGDGGVGGTEGGSAGEGGSGGSCESGYIVCRGNCIDPLSDPNYCGAKGTCGVGNRGEDCDSNETCQQGKCCPNGWINCEGDCINPLLDQDHCGAEGACNSPETDGDNCTAGTENCSAGECCPAATPISCKGQCIDPMTDEAWCGATDSCNTDGTDGEKCASGWNCVEGVCCNITGGMVFCDGKCINPKNDEAFCGAGGGATCNPVGKSCGGTENVCCDGDCIDPLTDEAHCGASASACTNMSDDGNSCTGATPLCTNGRCCAAGEVWCATPSPGGCIDPLTDEAHCGVSERNCGGGDVCTNGEICDGGVCKMDD